MNEACRQVVYVALGALTASAYEVPKVSLACALAVTCLTIVLFVDAWRVYLRAAGRRAAPRPAAAYVRRRATGRPIGCQATGCDQPAIFAGAVCDRHLLELVRGMQ